MRRIHLIAIALAFLIGCGSTDTRPGEGASDGAGQAVRHDSEIAEHIDRYLRAMEALGLSGASLPVDDLGEPLRRVREGGGEIIKGSADAGHAVIRDPVGAFIALQANS